MKRVGLLFVALAVLAILTILCARPAEGLAPATVRIVVLPVGFTPGPQLDVVMNEAIAMLNHASYGKTVFSYVVATIGGPTPPPLGDVFLTIDPRVIGAHAGLCSFWAQASGVNPYEVEHETLHVLCLDHTSEAAYYPGDDIAAIPTSKVYLKKDPTDVMAAGATLSAYGRYLLGWLVPQRAGPAGPAFVHLTDIEAAPSAVTWTSAEGLTFWGELRGNRVFIRANIFYNTFIWAIGPGEEFRDTFGGVAVKAGLGLGDLTFSWFTPTPPDPNAPTPVPFREDPIASVDPCVNGYIGGMLRCTPLPTPTPGPCWRAPEYLRIPCNTPTPGPRTCTPTSSPAETPSATATPTPTMEPSLTPTETPTFTPTPTRTATAVSLPPTLPSLPKRRGGCFGFTAFSVGAILVGMRLQRQRR